MKRLLLLLMLALVVWEMPRGGGVPGQTWYLQLIRGDDQERPPAPEAQPAGPEVTRELQGVFKWRHYWELKRQMIVLRTGGSFREQIGAGREIKIARPDPDRMTIELYVGGKLSRRRKQSINTRFYIAGGDVDQKQCSFVVVRRDRPQDALKEKAPLARAGERASSGLSAAPGPWLSK